MTVKFVDGSVIPILRFENTYSNGRCNARIVVNPNDLTDDIIIELFRSDNIEKLVMSDDNGMETTIEKYNFESIDQYKKGGELSYEITC